MSSTICRVTPIEDFARRVRALRKTRGVSQGKLAKDARVSRGYLSRVEIGMQSPTLEVIERIAAALKVKASALLEDDVQPGRTPRRRKT